MSRRQLWRRVLDVEVTRWSARSAEELIEELHQLRNYEVEFEGRTYQVEVQMLENTDGYVHVAVAVDDGMLPAAIVPACDSFVRPKRHRSS
ncbi:MAG TPA: hypothetical protein VGQ90_00455 [Stellaceae bacterium]|jgi:hypothetical protein|nr:hypothetical protein [Stellaceae bacterium]